MTYTLFGMHEERHDGDFYEFDSGNGTEWIPVQVFDGIDVLAAWDAADKFGDGMATLPTSIAQYLEATHAYRPILTSGYGYRLSETNGMNVGPWSVFETADEREAAIEDERSAFLQDWEADEA